MALYRYRIKPLSALATPLRSDTLYGHLLWMAAQWQGPARVAELIDAFSGAKPPFRLSSAFPSGTLPKPQLPGIPRGHFEARFARHGELVTQLKRYKKFRKQAFVPLSSWRALAGNLSQEALFEHWLNTPSPSQNDEQAASFSAKAHQPHNSIDRRTGSVLAEGGLFFTPATWYGPQSLLDLYVESDDIDLFETLMGYLAQVGYGADCNVGKGQFSFERDTDFDAATLTGQGDHRLCLSVCAAEDTSAFRGYWAPFVKHGRAWNATRQTHPFKKPFLAFAEGSVFSAMPESGYVLRNIHSDARIVQVTWPLTIPVTLEANHAS